MRSQNNPKKLVLNKETVRALEDSDLRAVVGGRRHVKRLPGPPEQTLSGCMIGAELQPAPEPNP